MKYRIELDVKSSQPISDMLEYLAKQGVCARTVSKRAFGDCGEVVEIVTMAEISLDRLNAINSNNVGGLTHYNEPYDFQRARISAVKE